jgi:hypothetical protein
VANGLSSRTHIAWYENRGHAIVIRLNSKQLPETHRGVAFVRVLTDQDATPIPIRVTWERTPVFHISPSQLVFGGNQRSGKVMIESFDRMDFRITGAIIADDRVAVRSAHSSRGKATIAVQIRGDHGIRVSDTLVVSTDRKEQPELRIPVLVLIP